MLDLPVVRSLQYPQVGIVGNILCRLTVTQARGQETHQLTIVTFHKHTWSRLHTHAGADAELSDISVRSYKI